METPNSSRWSELPLDILRSLFERLSFVDFHRAKIVCTNWYLCSKQTLHKKRKSPWLMLFPEDGCVLYNPEEDRVYKTKRDLSKTRFLANSGNLFLTLDSKSNLYIIDLFSEKRINLPPLDSIKGLFTLKRIGDKEFDERLTSGDLGYSNRSVVDLRGLLWVDDKTEEYTVAWFFYSRVNYIAICKNGEDHYRTIPTGSIDRKELQGLSDLVLRGDILYVYTIRRFIRILDLSRQEGFNGIVSNTGLLRPPSPPSSDDDTTSDGTISSHNIVVTTLGEVLLVESIVYEVTSAKPRISFRLYKEVPNPNPDKLIYRPNVYVKVDSIGDEALLLDLGITVPADHTLGIEPNSIYFTRHDRVRNCKEKFSCRARHICVFNLGTKNLTRFPNPQPLPLKAKGCSMVSPVLICLFLPLFHVMFSYLPM